MNDPSFNESISLAEKQVTPESTVQDSHEIIVSSINEQGVGDELNQLMIQEEDKKDDIDSTLTSSMEAEPLNDLMDTEDIKKQEQRNVNDNDDTIMM